MAVILIVDDEPLQRTILKTILTDEGYETHEASSGGEALKVIKAYNPDIVLTDLKMDGMDGIELLGKISDEKLKSGRDLPMVIIMTAFGTVHSAVNAMKRGAFDYLTKPLDKDVVMITLRRALERIELVKKTEELQQALYNKFRIEGIVGRSQAINNVLQVIRKVAPSPATVLILGESGTGKELIARAIHFNRPRTARNFTAINCAAIPETLLESELFGYEPGAFTGAASRKIGLFEATNGGTLFLDEIGDLPALTQAKILRVLQEKEVRRLGGRESFKVDVRIIAATNKDLEKEMREGKFREDLFYRLKVVSISLPPLRERREDIPGLAELFLMRFNNEFGKKIKRIDETAIRAFMDFEWPGNVRQFQSVIEKAVLMCESDTITIEDVRAELNIAGASKSLDIEIPEDGLNLDELERCLLRKAMEKSDNVVARAARLVGMSYYAFYNRWEKILESKAGQEVSVRCPEIPESGIDWEKMEKDLLRKAMARSNNVIARAARLLGISYKSFYNRWEKIIAESPSSRREESL